MTNKTNEDYEMQRNKQVSGLRSVLDYLMGIVIIIIGVVIITKFMQDLTLVAFGAVSILYGIWRLYKGYKKNYFK